MNKPIIRWTIGNVKSSGYEILNHSIKNIQKLYSEYFKYFVCYNDVDKEKIEKIKNNFKNVEFLEQNWNDCPIALKKPEILNKNKQKLNGSFWKICPPRLSKNTHEIILDNDLIFLKKPKLINQFLENNKKNLIIKDSKIYLGSYEKLLKNEKQGYNSGVIGLYPGYDFEKDIIKNFEIIENKKNCNYGEEQGLLMYTLYQTNPLIGSSENFVGIHPKIIFLNSLSEHFLEYRLEKIKDIDKNKFIEVNEKILKTIFSNAEVIHFLESNRQYHSSWDYFKKILMV